MVVSAIDNLIKGASGAAVQNFNLMHGFEENHRVALTGCQQPTDGTSDCRTTSSSCRRDPAAGVYCGVKSDAAKLDLSLIVSDRDATGCGVYTQNLVKAARSDRPRAHAG